MHETQADRPTNSHIHPRFIEILIRKPSEEVFYMLFYSSPFSSYV